MTVGIEIYNNAGTIQIDENWRNYGFREKVTLTITTSNIVGSPYPQVVPYSLAITGTPALIVACRSTSQFPFRLHSYYDAGSWHINWHFWHDEGTSGTYEPSTYTGTVDFFIFDTLEGTYGNVGLQVFNASGQTVFHSDASIMKISGVFACTSSFSWSDGRSYAPIIMQIPAQGIFVSGSGNRIGQYCLRTVGSQIQSRRIINNTAGSGGTYSYSGLYAAIDVTGF
jgi:hypothetical protein